MDYQKLEYKGEEALKEIERLTSDADVVQRQILEKILERNGGTEYLSKYMKGRKDISEFKKSVPVITYKDVEPYIQRIASGEDSSLLSGHPITEMLNSSGTSGGEPKLIPSIAEDLDRRTYFYNLLMPIVNQYVPGLDKGKAMYLSFVKSERTTTCGLPARTCLTSYYNSMHYKSRSDSFNDYTSPDAAVLCLNTDQSMYCQLIAGLVHRRSVLRLGSVFASALLRAISFLNIHWPSICTAIRTRTLDPEIVTDPACRAAMSALLAEADPSLADEIAEICQRTTWKGIFRRLWPEAKYMEAIITGTMAQYVPSLEYYCEGKLPLVCPLYAASESYFAVNLRPLCDPSEVSFTCVPNMCYFEFIPLGESVNGALVMEYGEDEAVPSEKLADFAGVKPGWYYEIVVTTFAGLNRYRIGDVLLATGFHNKSPQFRFICRRNVLLSVDMDKTNEADLHKSVSAAAKRHLAPLLLDYTSFADTSAFPGHYVLFWELQHDDDVSADISSEAMRECCAAVEQGLDCTYKRCRAGKSVGPLEIRLVRQGTFEKLMDLLIGEGGSINQYKTPRCIKSHVVLNLLQANVNASFFSPKEPTLTHSSSML